MFWDGTIPNRLLVVSVGTYIQDIHAPLQLLDNSDYEVVVLQSYNRAEVTDETAWVQTREKQVFAEPQRS